MLVNIKFWQVKIFYRRKGLLEKVITIKKFEYSPLDNELKKTDIAKDQYKFFKDQINVVNSNGEDDV